MVTLLTALCAAASAGLISQSMARRAGVVAATPRHRPPLGAAARRRAIRHGWPDAVDLLLLTIRSGYLPSEALAMVCPFVAAPIAAAFEQVVNRPHGQRFADGLQRLNDELGAPAGPLVDSLAAADRYGMPLAPILDRLAADARDQRRREAEARVRELPTRLAIPMVLCVLPAFVLLAIAPMVIAAIGALGR